MELKIVTPDRVVLETEAEAVYAVSQEGRFGVLPQHIPMVTPLGIGVLEYVRNGEKHAVAVMGGLFQTDGKASVVLSDAAELGSDIDKTRAQHAKERAESRLSQRKAALDVSRAQQALARSLARLKAAKG